MPHDKKGRLIEVGDHLKFDFSERYDYVRQAWDTRPTIGRVATVTPGSESCNVQVVHLVPGYWPLKTETLTAKATELALKADGSEPAAVHEYAPPVAGDAGDPTTSGFGRVGAIVAMGLLALAALVAPAFAADAPQPACGTVLAPKACVSATVGGVSVITRGERKEYGTVGVAFEAPLGGFAAFAYADVFGIQDGEAADQGAARTFRVVKIDAGIGRSAGAFLFSARGGITYSIEGKIGAPIDPRMFDGQIEASLQLEGGGHLSLRGGHDGAVGGWAAAADIEIPVGNGPAIVARYEIPFQRDPRGVVPWAATLGARYRVKSFRIGGARK